MQDNPMAEFKPGSKFKFIGADAATLKTGDVVEYESYEPHLAAWPITFGTPLRKYYSDIRWFKENFIPVK